MQYDFLFLDRDGVINERLIDDYVKNPAEFKLIHGAKEALSELRPLFKRIFLVTNQQGVGKKCMSLKDLHEVHEFFLKDIDIEFDGIYYCTELAEHNPICRKPQPGMAWKAQSDFPEVDYSRSVMVGDSDSDIEFGNRLGMMTVFIGKGSERNPELECKDLSEFAYRYKTDI